MTSLLIVEDEESLAESLSFALEKYGYAVEWISDGSQALQSLKKPFPDLILLDVMLPGTDGFEVCRAVQKMEPSIPIIMITARTSETDRVVGLELGADDYVIKPFSIRELEARIKAVLRRRKSESSKPQPELQLDFDRRIAKRLGKMIELSPKEWEVLACLVKAQGNIVSKEKLFEEVWGSNPDRDPKTVAIHIVWLRQKLEEDHSNPKHIISIKGKGYCFEP